MKYISVVHFFLHLVSSLHVKCLRMYVSTVQSSCTLYTLQNVHYYQGFDSLDTSSMIRVVSIKQPDLTLHE